VRNGSELWLAAMVCMEEFECLEERFIEVDAGVCFGVEAFEACEEEV